MEKDKKSQLASARKMKPIQVSNPGYWCNDVAFYQDGVSFIHKTNPMSVPLLPKAREWRKKGEGLKLTAKGSKDLPGG